MGTVPVRAGDRFARVATLTDYLAPSHALTDFDVGCVEVGEPHLRPLGGADFDLISEPAVFADEGNYASFRSRNGVSDFEVDIKSVLPQWRPVDSRHCSEGEDFALSVRAAPLA